MNIAPLKKGQKVVKVLTVMGSDTATIQTVEKVSKGIATLEGSSLKFDAKTRREVDAAPFGPGISCRLVDFDDGEEKRWNLG